MSLTRRPSAGLVVDVPRPALLMIGLGLLESFSANFATMASFIWLTTVFLPQTTWDPPTASTLFMAVTGLSIFLLVRRIGAAVDRFKPHGLFLSIQASNLLLLPAMGAVIAVADPRHPWLTIAVIYVLDLLMSARASTYTGAVNVLIAHVVPISRRADYYSLDFRLGLIAVFLAPPAASYAVQRSVYLALGIAVVFTLLGLGLLLLPAYRELERRSYGSRTSWSLRSGARRAARPWRAGEHTANAPRRDPRDGLRSLRYVKHVGIMLVLMATEALGNRARESFDIYFVTDTLGRDVGDFGLLTVALAAGLTLGSLAVGWTRRVITWKLWPSACYVGFGACFAAKGLATDWVLVLLTTAGQGLCLGLMSGLFQTAKMQFTPRALVGRTSAAFGAVFQGVSTAGLLLWAGYAWVGSHLGPAFMTESGYRWAYLAGGVFIMAAGALSPRLYRRVEWRRAA